VAERRIARCNDGVFEQRVRRRSNGQVYMECVLKIGCLSNRELLVFMSSPLSIQVQEVDDSIPKRELASCNLQPTSSSKSERVYCSFDA
jgi:hypothetical protein